MKVIRNNVFETNSSTTHSLVMFNTIKACGLSVDNEKEVTLTIIPLYDDSYEKDKKSDKLNHASYMASYIYSMVMFKKYWASIGSNDWMKEDEVVINNKEIIDKLQSLLVELGYKISYRKPLVFDDKLWEESPVNFNDGSDLENYFDIMEVLHNKESLKDYINNYTWIIRYNG